MPRSARALVVELVADVKDFVKGTQEADDALSDFVRDADRDLDKLETAVHGVEFDKLGREAKDAAQDVERAFDNLAREAKQSFRKIDQAADQVNIGPMKEKMGEAGSEVGSEFAQNLGESLSSGDLTSLAQDTAGGLIGAFQGIGGGIGIGLAGAAAVATTIFAKIQAEAEAKAERIKTVTASIFDELSGAMKESLEEMTRGQAYNDFVAGFSKDGDLADGMKQMSALARKAGVNVGDIAAAFVNGGPAAETMRKRLTTIKDEGTRISANAKGTQTSMSGSAKAADKLSGYLAEADTATRHANDAARAYWESWIGITQEVRLAEAAASRASSQLARAARAAAQVRGAPGTVVGGRRLAN